ncbi:DUF1707 domain-containing protein [Actinoplanes sp. NPDC026623]|uniref:DUF1707 SHOCT-like domain-containing protein n=1 Tax=Actinoplanes sp. NPDC026623 TaxID=3155610 RepID=UPI0033EFA84E
MGHDEMRAGDSERQAVADQLKAALDEGRLDLHEYDERLQRAYAAKTYADLDGLVTDLPGTIPAQRSRVEPVQAPSAAPGAREPRKAGVRPYVSSYGALVLVCVVIWGMSCLSSGELVYFWPGWMLIPLLLGLLGRFNGRNR